VKKRYANVLNSLEMLVNI